MHPILFRIGPLTVYSYGVLLVIAFYVSLYFLIIETKKKGIDTQTLNRGYPSSGQTILDIALLIIVSGVLGGKLAYIILNLPSYIKNPLDINLWRGGFIFTGGFVLSLAAVFMYTKKKKISFLSTTDLFIPYVALGQAIGRIGCFLNGCCYGRPTTFFIGRVFKLNSSAGYHYGALPLHPVQLYSSFFLFVLFLFLKKTRANRKFEGEALLLYLILYPSFRFFMDFLRGDRLETIFYHLNIFQIICIGIVILASAVFMVKPRRPSIQD